MSIFTSKRVVVSLSYICLDCSLTLSLANTTANSSSLVSSLDLHLHQYIIDTLNIILSVTYVSYMYEQAHGNNELCHYSGVTWCCNAPIVIKGSGCTLVYYGTQCVLLSADLPRSQVVSASLCWCLLVSSSLCWSQLVSSSLC